MMPRWRWDLGGLVYTSYREHIPKLFTVDLPVPGSRYRDTHSGLRAPPGFRSQARRLLQAMGKPGWVRSRA